MKGTNLGELEELILLTVAMLYDNAYAIAIRNEIKEKCNRSITISTVHAALIRLEKRDLWTPATMGPLLKEEAGESIYSPSQNQDIRRWSRLKSNGTSCGNTFRPFPLIDAALLFRVF